MKQTEPSGERFYDDQLDRQFNEASREDPDPDEPEPEPSDPNGSPRSPDHGSAADFERASRFDREDEHEPER